MQRVDDAYDHRYHAAVRLVEGGAGGVSFSVHQDGITDACMGIIQSDEIPLGWIAGKGQGLHDQQTPVFIIRVADGCNNGAYYFANGHIRVYLFIAIKHLINNSKIDRAGERPRTIYFREF